MGVRIIFEGIDNTGKTTQIKLVESFLNNRGTINQIIKFSNPSDGRGETQCKTFVDNLREMTFGVEAGGVYLTDRDIYGEYVYNPIYRKTYYNYIWDLEKVFKSLTNHSIFFLFEDKVKNVIARDDGKSFSIKYWKKLYEKWRFRIAYWKSKVPYKFRINIANKSPNQVFDIVFERLYVLVEGI